MMRRSQAQASTQPPATAWPLIAATTGLGKKKIVSYSRCSRRKEVADVIRSAVERAQEVDAGREDRALPAEHDRTWTGCPKLVEFDRKRVAEFAVERIGLAVRHRNDGHVAARTGLEHVLSSACTGSQALRHRYAAASARASHQPLRMHHRDREHHERHGLMQQRERERRLVQQGR